MGGIDYSDPFGIELREVAEVEHQGAPARAVTGSRRYLTAPEALWAALTDPERLARWFAPVSGSLEIGGRFAIEGNADGTITRCEAPEVIDLTWELGGNVSWVALRLRPEDGGTRLTLVHTFAKDDGSEEHWAKFGPGAVGVGWDLAFFGLGLYLAEDGEMMDRGESLAWMESDACRAFMTDCATAWGEEHVASGADPAVARAMAVRTAKFYSGEG